jgi:hypothetical protein
MSSSNSVSVTYIDEVTYGTTPDPTGAVTINQVRFTSESLSGTPSTTESAAIRTDRMSSGQVVTGLEVGGDINFELSRDSFMDDFFALGMMSTWTAATSDVTSVSFTIDGADPQRGDLAGTGVGTGMTVGDILKVTDGSDDYVFQIITITDADNLVVACEKDQVDFTGATSRRPAYLDIGSTQNSVTMAKAYEDVTDGGTDEHSQTYSGCIVSGFSLNAAYGSIVTGAFNLSANGYVQEDPSYQQKVITGGGSITPAPTAQALNASVDVPIVTTSGAATTFCLENISLNLDNGLTPQNCIGKIAPRRYELGTAGITVEAGLYLGEQSYEAFMPSKLTQAPISMAFVMKNADSGGYAFVLPAVQLSFPDPSAGGANQPVMIEAQGTAKVGASGESALRIYQI